MELLVFLLLALSLSTMIIIILLYKLHGAKKRLITIHETLEDIRKGNLNRRLLTDKKDITQDICYSINQIAVDSQARLAQQKQSEQTYKRLMTSLSHDVKTPLASLLGYLEAVENKIVSGVEKDEYIRIALNKARSLKDFVYSLFEWVKLDSGEQVLHFEVFDICELCRNILADWVPILENNNFTYEISIPEKDFNINVDISAFTRVLDNLIQNIINHSKGSKVEFNLNESETQIIITVSDNGMGISENDLPHIFERMYTSDYSRSARGTGLGLSIVKELISIHRGTIIADSIPGVKTSFTIALPKTNIVTLSANT
jgi:signal transduction histidine kinase